MASVKHCHEYDMGAGEWVTTCPTYYPRLRKASSSTLDTFADFV